MCLESTNNRCIVCGCSQSSTRYFIGTHEIRQCKECGLGYTWPQIVKGDLDQNNQTIYTVEKRLSVYESHKGELTRRYSKRLNEISFLLGDEKGSLLDIGCSIGFFLERARGAGWDVKGVEMNAETGSYARDQLNLDVFVGKLEEAHYEPGEFDVITAWDVIEHVQDPLALLQESKRLLRPGGILALQVPNMDSVMASLTAERWEWWSVPDHTFHFTPGSLIHFLDKNGLRIENLKTWEPPRDFLLNILLAAAKVDLQRLNFWDRKMNRIAWELSRLITPIIVPFQHYWWKRNRGALIVAFVRK